MDNIRVSVVIPTYNRLLSLQRALDALLCQEYPHKEIIVVDDGSVDGTSAFLGQVAAKGKIVHVRQNNLGPAAARNAGAGVATGAIMLFTDDDCTVPPEWIHGYVGRFAATDAAAIGGTVRNAISGNYFSELSQQMTNYFVTALAAANGSTLFLTSNNLGVRTTHFRTCGGFDERFTGAGGEERDLLYRIHAHGGSCLLEAHIMVEHHHDLSFTSFLRQQKNYGRGAYLLHGRRPGTDARMTRIPRTVYAGLIRTFFRKGTGSGILKTLFFLLGQCAATTGYLRQMLSRRNAPRTA